MYKKILVPVDGSETAALALGHAVQLAKEQGASLHLAFVVEQTPGWTAEGYIDLDKVVREEGRKALERAAQAAREGGVAFETSTLEGGVYRVARVIAEQAERVGADLIVMGTHGRSGIDHLILGSVAEGVVRLTKSPVLLVRAS